MADNPLYDDSLRHWLNFKSPDYGRIEITEPLNFDSFSFKIKQRTNGFGRDKEIGGEEIDLEFGNVYGEKAVIPQTLIDGTVIYELSHRLDLIFEAIREKGSETEIEYILSRNDVDFVTGLLDIPESTTDGYASFKCSVVQNTNKALIERKKDIKADVFSDKDTFGNPQIPLEKTKVLLKAKPTKELSEWSSEGLQTRNTIGGFLLNTVNIDTYGVRDTFTPFDTFIGGTVETNINDAKNFNVITAVDKLTSNVFTFKGKVGFNFVPPGAPFPGSPFVVYLYAFKSFDADFETSFNNSTPLFTSDVLSMTSLSPEPYYIYDLDITTNIVDIESGEGFYVFFVIEHLGTGGGSLDTFYYTSKMTFTTSSVSVDSVIDGVGYYDYLNKGVKSVSGIDFYADDIQLGEFKDQFIFNGNLIRQKNNISLNFVFKDEMNDLQEVNMDYQIYSDKIDCFQYPEFYREIDMGAYLQTPDLKFERKFNDRFKKISLEYNYKTFEQDRDEKNTVDAFHTESQFLFPTTKVDDKLEININHIRDPFTIELARREAIKETTALSTDDKIFIIDCVKLPDGSMNEFTRALQMQVQTTPLGWLFIRSNGFKWTLLGFKNGDTVFITFGENKGEYAVIQMSDDILELIPQDFEATFSGIDLITFRYPLTNVEWVNRTNEGFDIIENLDSPDRCSNLKYTIKRNLTRNAWSSYLSTICKDNLDGIIRCTDFKVNGELTTQFEGGEILREKDDIVVSTLSEKILDKYEYKTQVAISFEDAKQLIEDVVNVRGFIRIFDTQNRVIKIHPKLLDMSWSEGIMEIVGESRNESDFVVITSNIDGINIFNVGYDSIINRDVDWFKIVNDYVQIFDNNQRPLINATNFKKISLNGIFYTDKDLFFQTLYNL